MLGKLLFSIILISLNFLSAYPMECPRGCVCENGDTELKCQLPAARIVPQSIFPRNTTKLDLSDNNILNVPPGCLTAIPNVEELILDSNKIYFLDDGAFKGARMIRKLSMEDNNIHVIEEKVFSSLVNLQELNLMKNQLKAFPNLDENILLLSLSLSFNKIERIPANALKRNILLSELRLRSNELQQLPRDIFPEDVLRYKTLDLVRNRLRDTPEVVNEMTNLESLMLCFNPIKVFLPRDFRPLASLKTLTLTDVGLTEFPENVFWLPSLEYLDISKNKIATTSLKNMKFQNLKKLKLSGNPLARITGDVFWGVRNLETLLASSCELTGIDYQALEPLIKLRTLDLHNNKLRNFPRLRENVELEEINIDQNNITRLGAGSLSLLTNLKMLSMANNSLASLPSHVFQEVSSITSLNLSGNKLVKIPAVASSSMPDLKSLDMSGNKLVEIASDSFSGLNELETLNLRDNELTALDSERFSPLLNLKNLYLCRNNLTSLDGKMLAKLPNLVELTADHNHIQQIFNGTFDKNPDLKKISLKSNHLATIERESFSPLANLTELLLIYNDLSSPPNISRNHKLKVLGLCNNPLGNLSTGSLVGPRGLEVVLLRSLGLSELNSDIFGNLRSIKYLHLAFDNYLTRVPLLIRNMTSLRILKLTGNPIVYVSARDFEGLNNLRELRMDNTELKSMDVTQLFPTLPAIRTLYLSGNNWHCDCELQWYALGVDGARARVTTEDREKITCSSPGRLAGKSFDELRLGDFGHCVASNVIKVTDQSAIVTLPSIAKMASDYTEVYNRVSYLNLTGGKEMIVMAEKHLREINLSSLIPHTSYLVCVSTVTSTPVVTSTSTGDKSPKIVTSTNYQVASSQESCHRFKTLESASANSGFSLNRQHLVIIYGAIGGTLAAVIITVLIAYVVWCTRVRGKFSESCSPLDGIANETDQSDRTERDRDDTSNDGHVGTNGKSKKGTRSNKSNTPAFDGDVVEMSIEDDVGQDNEACVEGAAQRTKL